MGSLYIKAKLQPPSWTYVSLFSSAGSHGMSNFLCQNNIKLDLLLHGLTVFL